MDLPDIFHTLSFAIESLRGAKLNRGLLTREKRVSLAVRPRSRGTMRPCRAQTLSYRRGGRSSGQSWLSCVPTMQASVESHVSEGAWGNRPQGGPIWLATKSPGTQLQIAGGKCGDRLPSFWSRGRGMERLVVFYAVLAQGSPRWGGACAWGLVGVGGLRHG